MKILIFHQYFLGKNDPGGSRWNQFSKYFSKDNQVTVIAGNIHYATGKKIAPKRWLNKEEITDNLKIYRSWTYSGYNANFFGRLIGYLSYTFSAFITGLFVKKADIIIVTSPPLFVGLSALLLSKIKRVPFFFEVRDLWPESAIATKVVANSFLIKIMYGIEKTLYKNALGIIPLTPAFKKDIIRRFPQYERKIEIITNGADLDLMEAGPRNNWVRKKFGWNGKLVFSYFGAHGVANDLMQVINVARLYRENNHLLFALIGDGMQKDALKKIAAEEGLKNVQFIDSVAKNQVADFINASDVCMAILKKTDTFKTVYPNKVFDYMVCKKPILVTIDGITRALIEESQSGFYCEPGNTEQFKQTIKNITLLDQVKLKQLGENGYRHVIKYFNREDLAQKYLRTIYQSGQ